MVRVKQKKKINSKVCWETAQIIHKQLHCRISTGFVIGNTHIQSSNEGIFITKSLTRMANNHVHFHCSL